MKQIVIRIRQDGRTITVVRKPIVNNTMPIVRNYYCVSQSSIDRVHTLDFCKDCLTDYVFPVWRRKVST